MTDIVIVGKAYYADLRPDQGLPPGSPGSPSHPIHYPGYPSQGLPGYPAHPIAPGSPGSPSHPIYNPAYPDQGLPGGQPYPDQGLPGVPPGFWGGSNPHPDQGLPGGGQSSGTPVPEDVYTPAPIPEEIASQYVVSSTTPRRWAGRPRATRRAESLNGTTANQP